MDVLSDVTRGIDHYENFPVASVLLPTRLRHPVRVIYRFARLADDIVDEGDATPAVRLRELGEFRRALDAIASGDRRQDGLFRAIADVIDEHRLPISLLYDLLDAFAQDVDKHRYANFAEVMEYCRRSANPIGRALLHLFGTADRERVERSDHVCSSLQLINFLQDIASDYQRGRIYLPQDELSAHGITEAQIARGDLSPAWREMMRFQIERALVMLAAGAPLGRMLPGRIGLEIRMIVAGGHRIVQKLQRAQGDVFRARPVLRAWDWPLILTRALIAPGPRP